MPEATWTEGVVTKIEGGVKIIIESKLVDGKKQVVTRTLKLVKKLESTTVNQRKELKKFGILSQTKYADHVFLKLNLPRLTQAKVEEEVEKKPKLSKITCRKCQGDHWTTSCPFKDTLPTEPIKSAKPAVASGKFVPMHLREGAVALVKGEKKDDPNTIRISNLSEDTTDQDVRDLVDRFGSVSRVVNLYNKFVSRDRDLDVCKGFAFVTFFDRSSAEACIDKLDGFGYDSLILKVDFAQRS